MNTTPHDHCSKSTHVDEVCCTECALRRALERVTKERDEAKDKCVVFARERNEANFTAIKNAKERDGLLVARDELLEIKADLIRERDEAFRNLVTVKAHRDWIGAEYDKLRKELETRGYVEKLFDGKGPTK